MKHFYDSSKITKDSTNTTNPSVHDAKNEADSTWLVPFTLRDKALELWVLPPPLADFFHSFRRNNFDISWGLRHSWD